MMPQARIAHRTRGRVRLSVPERRRDRDYFSVARDRLARIEGIDQVRVNETTGSVVVFHSELPFERLRGALERADLFHFDGQPDAAGAPGELETGDEVGKDSRGAFNLQSVLFLILMLMASRKYPRASLIVGLVPMVWQVVVLALRVRDFRKAAAETEEASAV